MATIKGIDVSSWQGNIDASKATDISFGIVKATEGKYYINPYMAQQVGSLRSSGKLVGYYHFVAGSDAKAEAQHFWSVVKGIIRKDESIWLDFEIPVADPDGYCATFLKEANRLSGMTTGIYMNLSTAHSLDWDKVRATDAALWLAWYSGHVPSPQPDPRPWRNLSIWQYSSTGTVKGITGNVDMNFFYGDADTLKKYGKKDGVTKPDVVSPVKPPAPKPSAIGTYAIKRNDTFWQIEASNNWAHGTLEALNPTIDPKKLAIGQIIVTPKSSGSDNGTSSGIYIIQPGDTLSGIAAKFKTTVDKLVLLNNIPNPDIIPAGGQLYVGSKAPSKAKGEYVLKKATTGYMTAADALAGKRSNSVVPAGTYSIFNRANGTVNITRQAGTPGWWIKG